MNSIQKISIKLIEPSKKEIPSSKNLLKKSIIYASKQFIPLPSKEEIPPSKKEMGIIKK